MQMKTGELGKIHLLQLSEKEPLAFTIQSFYTILGIIIVVHGRSEKRKQYSKKLFNPPQFSPILTAEINHIFIRNIKKIVLEGR